uniref:Hepatocyte growth factor-regulated tyrosine kinase substrate n=1 Tax=Saccoglossus kowalevskii TaxID=10224 RepID=A0ABM0M433_SACKO|nr:PREDICTED: hepatocyte growth factor-regulated tyrosine kinase substrate-like isoform X2 [Saccoglossus kowalevskii]
MFSSKGSFDKLVDKATSQLLLEPDWDATLQICDCIRQGDVTPKYAVTVVRRKLQDKNPHVCAYGLHVLESAVKNCGTLVYEEVATKSLMDEFRELTKTGSDKVKNKILELIQAWAHAFRNEPNLKIVEDTYHLMKMEGYSFPPLKESDAMFAADKAPEWVDGEVCHRCRVEFGMMQRKHHCRHCGQVFCNKCTSKSSTIPKFGIEKEVRVCEACHDKLNKTGGAASSAEGDLPAEYLASPLAQQSQVPAKRSEIELQEEEELQLAMALSLDEAENRDRIRKNNRSTVSSTISSSPPASTLYSSTSTTSQQDMDPELARYLNRSYWEQKHDEQKTAPSAPTSAEITPATAPPMSGSSQTQPAYSSSGKVSEYPSDNGEHEQFLQTLSTNIDVFVNRMKSDSQRGRSIANDTSVQGLFQTITTMNPELLKIVDDLEDKRNYMESLQDKLAQIRDAREALDALREDHQEKIRREAEEAERQRQIQIAQKLEIMRQKKQEYLAYQRQLAMQRLQEQERELQMRLEQQKQQQQMRPAHYTAQYAPQGPPSQQYNPPQQTFSPPNSMQNSPVHSYKMAQQPAPGTYMEQSAQAQVNGVNQGPAYTQQNQYQQPQQNVSYAPPQSQQYPPQGQYQPPQPQSTSSFSAPSSLDYNSATVEYSPHFAEYQQPNVYNMQGMANSLPQLNQGQQPPPPEQQLQQQQPPPQSQQQYGMPQQGQGNVYPQQPPMSGPAPQQSYMQEAQLISFD